MLVNGRLLSVALTTISLACVVGIVVLAALGEVIPDALELGLTGTVAGLIGHYTKPPGGGA